MITRRLGSLDVSAVGLGCNQFARKLDPDESARVVHAAIDAGVTFFDTADRYGYGDRAFSGHGQSEVFLGRALRGRRDRAVIATKFGMPLDDEPRAPRADPAYIAQACEASLRRLGTDYIDLYLLHRPDPATPVAETLGGLTDLIGQGKVREIGWSNVTAEEVAAADDAAREHALRRFGSVQNEYSLLAREVEDDVLPACAERGISFIPYFPLASGLLTGKYRVDAPAPAGSRLATFQPNRPHLGLSDANLRLVGGLEAFASERGRSMVELAMSWLLSRPAVVSVIAGATTPEQAKANAVAGDWALQPDELAAVDAILATAHPADPPLEAR
jgi:aryl-alcohol dehydrogenase-like predicted oxidoreductase